VPLSKLTVSCCLIIKNEELFLRQCLESIVDWVDEILILDSESTDNSKEIAERFRSRVPHFAIETYSWNDDFSAARNQIASKAKNKWVLFLDGDEIIDQSGYGSIKQALSSDSVCFSLIQRNYTLDPSIENVQRCDQPPPGYNSHEPLFYFDNWMERLYRKDLAISYQGRIHESLFPSVQKIGKTVDKLDIVLHHYGRLKSTHSKKIDYYLKLSTQKWKEDRKNAAAWIEYLTVLTESNQIEHALIVAKEAASLFSHEPEILKTAFQIFLRADQFALAEATIRLYLRINPDDIYACSQLTTALLYQKKWSETLKAAHDLLQIDKNNFVAHLNLGVLYFEFKGLKKSKRLVRKRQVLLEKLKMIH
jgi:glycosyltransferase involved in cell wall biosynthesis